MRPALNTSKGPAITTPPAYYLFAGQNNFIVSCPSGKKVVGGGASVSSNAIMLDSRPFGETQWRATAQSSRLYNIAVFAICAFVQ